MPLPAHSIGEMAEWLNALAWNASMWETASRVRIPLSPPNFFLPVSGRDDKSAKSETKGFGGLSGRFEAHHHTKSRAITGRGFATASEWLPLGCGGTSPFSA